MSDQQKKPCSAAHHRPTGNRRVDVDLQEHGFGRPGFEHRINSEDVVVPAVRPPLPHSRHVPAEPLQNNLRRPCSSTTVRGVRKAAVSQRASTSGRNGGEKPQSSSTVEAQRKAQKGHSWCALTGSGCVYGHVHESRAKGVQLLGGPECGGIGEKLLRKVFLSLRWLALVVVPLPFSWLRTHARVPLLDHPDQPVDLQHPPNSILSRR